MNKLGQWITNTSTELLEDITVYGTCEIVEYRYQSSDFADTRITSVRNVSRQSELLPDIFRYHSSDFADTRITSIRNVPDSQSFFLIPSNSTVVTLQTLE